jgi:hypothetical protein
MVVTTDKCALTRRPVLEAEPTLESRLADARGYRVEADGDAGHVTGVALAGAPPRPVVLVVRDRDCVRFVSMRRVAAALSDERRVMLGPEKDQS